MGFLLFVFFFPTNILEIYAEFLFGKLMLSEDSLSEYCQNILFVNCHYLASSLPSLTACKFTFSLTPPLKTLRGFIEKLKVMTECIVYNNKLGGLNHNEMRIVSSFRYRNSLEHSPELYEEVKSWVKFCNVYIVEYHSLKFCFKTV